MFSQASIDLPVFPAIITGVAGLLGIVVNVSVSIALRNSERRETRHALEWKSLEVFFLPLCDSLYRLKQYIEKFESLDASNAGGKLCTLLSEKEPCDGNAITLVDDIKREVKEINRLLLSESCCLLDDYKIMFYFRIIHQVITGLNDAVEKRGLDLVPYNNLLSVYDGFKNRIDKKARNIYAASIFSRIRLKFWYGRQRKKLKY